MKKYNIICLLLIAVFLTSCNDFLSVRPSKSSDIVPTTFEHMESIVVGMWRNSSTSYNLVYGNDDIDLNADLERALPGTYDIQSIEAATWERENNGTNQDFLWLYAHQNIFRSNMVLNKLGDLKDATEEELQRLRAEAYFRRAYSYMELINVYTLPYCEANLNEPGLVKCETASFNYSLKRMSIKDTYDFIEKDIQEALKINVNLENRRGQGSPYRVTKASANAIAARFYLIKQDYAKAEQYAKASLAQYGENNILDYNTIGYSTTTSNGTITIDGKTIDFVVKYPGTYRGYDIVTSWTENLFLSTAVGYPASGFQPEYMISSSLEQCFEADGDKEMDARYKYFLVKNYCYLNGKPIDRPYDMRSREYCPSVPEMMLIVAECEARTGSISEAMNYVNKLRAKRIDPAGIINLTASTKDEAIAKVLRERRREMGPQNRLFDIRRYNSNDYAADDVTITRRFFKYTPAAVDYSSAPIEYTLKPGDRKIAAQIPEIDILAGNGQLKQNTY